jgi:hypothetical protein
MEPRLVDHLVRFARAATPGPFSRRIALAFALAGATGAEAVGARKRRKRKAKPLRFNAYGCINVGDPCRGNDELCCSGLCEGAGPRRGKRDTSRCVAHDAATCRAAPVGGIGFCGGADPASPVCGSATGVPKDCHTTTGNAGFCASLVACEPACSNDRECQQATANPGAACIRCTDCAGGTACALP